MEFYNVKTRKHVKIADEKCTKVIYPRETSTGTQYRYAVKAVDKDMNLTKFITKAAYEALACPAAKPAKKK